MHSDTTTVFSGIYSFYWWLNHVDPTGFLLCFHGCFAAVSISVFKLSKQTSRRSTQRRRSRATIKENCSIVSGNELFTTRRSSLAVIVGSALISPVSAIPLLSPDTFPSPPHNYTYELGLFFSWLCAFLYLSSRIPQILLNRSRRSVEGIAIPMFICAVMGNSTYALSLLLSDEAMMGGHEFWIASLPYLLGSAGTLIFDALIFAQSAMYRDNIPKQEDQED